MSIFGASFPKIVYDRGGENEETVLLPYAVIESNDVMTETVENESDLTGNRDYFDRGSHREIVMRYYLHKEADPVLKYEILQAYLNRSVSMFLHTDQGQILNTAQTADALFVLQELTPFYLRLTDIAVILKFVSLSTTYLGKA